MSLLIRLAAERMAYMSHRLKAGEEPAAEKLREYDNLRSGGGEATKPRDSSLGVCNMAFLLVSPSGAFAGLSALPNGNSKSQISIVGN